MTDVYEIRRKSIAGVFGYALRTIFLQIIGLVATALLGYYLNPEEFGIYFIVTAVVGLFTFLSDIGLAAALVQKKDEPTTDDLRTTFTVQQGLAVLIFVVVVALTPLWKTQHGLGQEGIWLLYALAFSFLLASLKTIPSILLERRLEFNKLVLPQIFENLVFYATTVILAAQGFGVRSYTVAVLLRGVVGIIVMYFLQRWQIGFAFSRTSFRALLKFGAKFQLNDLLARLKDDLFIVVLARFIPAAEMGYISWAKRWSMYPYQVSVNSVMAVTFPTYSRLQEHKEILKRAIEKSLFFIALVIFPVLAGMSITAMPLLEMIPRYIKWAPALPSLYFFSVNIAWAAISTPLTNTLNAIGKIDSTLKLMVMWTALTWTLTPVAIILFGFTGVALASAVIACSSVVTVYMVKKYVPIEVLPQVWRQTVASLVLLVVAYGVQRSTTPGIPSFIAQIIFGSIAYITTLAAVGYSVVMREVRSVLHR